jgi:fructosamine-3-kinase
MSLHDSDISWQVLRGIVQDWAGTGAELAEVKPLEGGCISNTLAVTTKDGRRAVLKISPHRVNRDYLREVYQLDLLRDLGIPTPHVYACKVGSLEDPHSYILMEFCDGIDLVEAKKQCTAEEFDALQQDLAEVLLKMHSNTSPTYAKLTGPECERFQSWPVFYRKVYDTIWHEAEREPALPKQTRKLISKVHEKLERLLAHDDVPRLVHWDVWATNLLARPDESSGKWKICAVLDPNCKYAHAEAELAYMDLFHTSTPAFVKAYQTVRKLDEAYHRVRKVIYQLYPLINHFNLFGIQYVNPLGAMAERAAALV